MTTASNLAFLPPLSRAPPMGPHELMDAALAGLDRGESASVRLLSVDERRRLAPFQSRRHAADRYRLASTEDLR